jgi:hypothetical protein
MEKKKIKYSEGDIFIIETENKNKYLGLIARRKGRTKGLLGYFWRLTSIDFDNIVLDMFDVFLITKFSALGFEIGNWVHIGKYKHWVREDWVMPKFRKFEESNGNHYIVTYNEDFESFNHKKVSETEANQYFPDGSHGYISLENELQRMDV